MAANTTLKGRKEGCTPYLYQGPGKDQRTSH